MDTCLQTRHLTTVVPRGRPQLHPARHSILPVPVPSEANHGCPSHRDMVAAPSHPGEGADQYYSITALRGYRVAGSTKWHAKDHGTAHVLIRLQSARASSCKRLEQVLKLHHQSVAPGRGQSADCDAAPRAKLIQAICVSAPSALQSA